MAVSHAGLPHRYCTLSSIPSLIMRLLYESRNPLTAQEIGDWVADRLETDPRFVRGAVRIALFYLKRDYVLFDRKNLTYSFGHGELADDAKVREQL